MYMSKTPYEALSTSCWFDMGARPPTLLIHVNLGTDAHILTKAHLHVPVMQSTSGIVRPSLEVQMAFGYAMVLAAGQITSGAAFKDVLVWEVLSCNDRFPVQLPRQLVDGDEPGAPYVALDPFVAAFAFSVERP